ncbi:MAG: SPI-4 type I secretion system protein SiiC [Calditrichia bacterium]
MKRLYLIIVILIATGYFYGQSSNVLTLEQCIQQGLKNHPTILSAKYQSDMAKNNLTQSYGSWLPTISANVGFTKSERGPSSFFAGEYVGPDNPFTNTIVKSDNYSQRVTVNWNFLDVGVHYYSTKAAQADVKASKMNYISAKNQTIMNIIEKFYNVIKQKKIVEALKKAVERSEEQVRRAEAMYNVGSAAKIDLYRAKVNFGNDKMALLSGENELENSRQLLNLAIGQDPLNPIDVEAELEPVLNIEEFSGVLEKFQNNNPTIENLKLNRLSSKFRKFAALGNYFPTIGFYAGYSRSVPQSDFLFKEFDREYSWYYGVSLNFNLFNGFRDHANYQNSVINFRIANENLRLQEQQNLSQLKYLYNRFQTLLKVRETNLLNLEAAQEEYNLAQERYRVGSGTSLEVRDAQVKLSQAEQTLIEADFNLITVYYQIKALTNEIE